MLHPAAAATLQIPNHPFLRQAPSSHACGPHLRLQPVYARRKRARRSGSADVRTDPPLSIHEQFEKVLRTAGMGFSSTSFGPKRKPMRNAAVCGMRQRAPAKSSVLPSRKNPDVWVWDASALLALLNPQAMVEPGRHILKARASLSRGEFAEVLRQCDLALAENSEALEAHVLAGKAAYYSGDYATAEQQYRRAIASSSSERSAYEGLAELQVAQGDLKKAAETYDILLDLAIKKKEVAKQREYLWRLAETLDRAGAPEQSERQLKDLLAMNLTQEQKLEALCFLADMQIQREHVRQERIVHDRMVAEERTHGRILRTVSAVRLVVDAERSDQLHTEHDGLADTLKAIVRQTNPGPRYVKYHEHHLQRYLSSMGNYPPRSAARNNKRIEAMKECVRMITTSCCTPFPFEAAIWLLEEQEELYGGTVPVYAGAQIELSSSPAQPPQVLSPVRTQLNWYRGNSVRHLDREAIFQMVADAQAAEEANSPRGEVVHKVEEFGMKLAHQFPWTPAAAVAVGLALRRRFLSDPEAPSTIGRRKQITKSLKKGVERGADSAAGWKALAELQYQNRQWQEAYETSVKGLEWSVKRRRAGHETLTHFALALRLCVARCLRRLGRLDEAEHHFKILAGWTSEGDTAFCELAGSAPLSVRQQAMRGIAKVALERGERDIAKAQYERILGKALMGRGPPAQHWAHSEYAWLLFEDGDLAAARDHLEKALAVARQEGCAVTDSEIGEHHYKLGRIMWTMGGNMLTDHDKARAHFQAASMEEGDAQAPACAWLGHWYKDIAGEPEKAINCYEKALEIDPRDRVTAETLRILKGQPKPENGYDSDGSPMKRADSNKIRIALERQYS
ncbi:hypothetical protein WJX72_010484 [[Myrmecia] bisecta]|uniref:PsbB mRNA maturation factor Mbb1 n=1 Tax=[Myrmecia] bisecta TaxID=41462 RepID=A0AAW1PMD3_9CHLO